MSEPAESSAFYSPFAVGVWVIIVFIGSQILAVLAVLMLSFVLNGGGSQSAAWLDTNWGQFLFVLLAEAITLRLIWQLMKKRSISWRTIGLNRLKLVYIAYAVVGSIVYFVSYLFILGIASQVIPGLNVEQQQDIGFSKSTAGIALLPIFISLVLLPPFVEEIVARGFLYTNLRSKLAFLPATIVTSLLFAAAHLGGGLVGEGLLWIAALDTFILSIVMCYLREKTGSLWPAMGVHFIKNGIAFIILFNIVKYFR